MATDFALKNPSSWLLQITSDEVTLEQVRVLLLINFNVTKANIELFSEEERIFKLNLPYTTKLETVYNKLYPLDNVITVTKYHHEVTKNEYLEYQKMCAKFKSDSSSSTSASITFTEAQPFEDHVDSRGAKRHKPTGGRSFNSLKRRKQIRTKIV